MLTMFLDSVKLFLQGKLFRDGRAVFRLWIVGFAAALVLTIALVTFLHPWIGGIAGGLAGGALMPYLFRNLKYN
jgi:hypothetical protein